MKTVLLDPYRTPGVRVFSGDERGKLVAEAIMEEHGRGVVVAIPEDVWSISFSFWRGFFEVLPEVEVRGHEVHMKTMNEMRALCRR